MPTPNLGSGIDINVASLLATGLLIESSSGGGKSWAVRRLLEQRSSHVRQWISDPKGESATLGEKYDYVVCAAQDGDPLAHPRTAHLLARRLLKSGVSGYGNNLGSMRSLGIIEYTGDRRGYATEAVFPT